jgi:hypothetical protein
MRRCNGEGGVLGRTKEHVLVFFPWRENRQDKSSSVYLSLLSIFFSSKESGEGSRPASKRVMTTLLPDLTARPLSSILCSPILHSSFCSLSSHPPSYLIILHSHPQALSQPLKFLPNILSSDPPSRHAEKRSADPLPHSLHIFTDQLRQSL